MDTNDIREPIPTVRVGDRIGAGWLNDVANAVNQRRGSANPPSQIFTSERGTDYIDDTGTGSFPASGVWGDAAQIDLTTGDWDVTVTLQGQSGNAASAFLSVGIGTVSGNTAPTDEGDNWLTTLSIASSRPAGLCVANYRVQPTATTTYYAKIMAQNGAATATYTLVRISARRMGSRTS